MDTTEYTLEVTPDAATDPATPVVVTIAAAKLADAVGNVPTAAATGSYTPPPAPDTTPPTVVSFVSDGKVTNGNLTFTITFSKALGDTANGLGLPDLDIAGGDAVASTQANPNPATTDGIIWTLLVTPHDASMPQVTVSIKDTAEIYDANGNPLDLAGSADTSESVDAVYPRLLLALSSVDDSDSPNLVFTLIFSEPVDIDTLKLRAINQSTSHNLKVDLEILNPRRAKNADGTDNLNSIVITATMTNPALKTASVTLRGGEDANAGVVLDMAGNGLARNFTLVYMPASADPGVPDPTIAGPDTLSCLTGGTITVTFDEALKTGEALAAGDIELTGTGWEMENFDAAAGTFDLMPMDDRSWIGTTQVTVTVKANVVVDADDKGNTAESMDFTVGPVLTIPANGYIVVIRENALLTSHLFNRLTNRVYRVDDSNVGSGAVSVQLWDCMPDLGVRLGTKVHTFAEGRGHLIVDGGGGLIVKRSPMDKGETDAATAQIAEGTVGITEIMWAVDAAKLGQVRNFEQSREQWIELHNLNNREVKVTLFDLLGDEAYSNNIYGTEIDRVSNFNLYGNSWPIRDANRGQDGDSNYGQDFIAMQRGPANAAKNYLHGDFNGRTGARWTQATAEYLNLTSAYAGSGIAVDNFDYQFIGTPGVRNNIGPATPAGVTSVPHKPFVINEVGNRANRLYDWIELRNTSGAEANLRNYQISIVTGVDNDHALFTFPNSDIKIGDNELILVLASDPEDDGEHPIAVSTDVRGGSDQVLGLLNNPAKYIVAERNERLYTDGLPAGNFVLILRHGEGVDISKPETYNGSFDKPNSADAKRGSPTWIVDVAGYHNSLGNRNTAPKYTAFWPLNGHAAPGSANEMKEGAVYFRRDATRVNGANNTDKSAFVASGYTGIGYRRHAQNVPEHGGTPGFHEIRKNLAGDIKDGIVTISEIMFDQGDGRYPQWIEIYNSSPTEAVNLHADAGWKLIIDNFDDGIIPLALVSGEINFKDSEVQTILPQQTVLVTSTRARTAGSDTTNASVVFIPTRVFSVWSEKPARDSFGMERSTDPILSEESFHIELVDGKGNSVDKVGNLTQSRGRVIDQVAWAWSEINAEPEEDGPRSSIIRRYREAEEGVRSDRWDRYDEDDIKDMGIEAAGWVAAHTTDFREVKGTWYGHGDDISSPGVTGGRVLPVSLSKFRPERSDDGTVSVRWITESELNNAGFNILRSETRDGAFTKLNTQLIAGNGTTSERNTYEFIDTSAKPNVVYYYQIQDVSFDGDVEALRITHLRGNVSAAGKLTTIWGELKALQ